MIKGLYFKLNIDKEEDNIIYSFFNKESKKEGINKIELLYRMIRIYIAASNDRIGGINND